MKFITAKLCFIVEYIINVQIAQPTLLLLFQAHNYSTSTTTSASGSVRGIAL